MMPPRVVVLQRGVGVSPRLLGHPGGPQVSPRCRVVPYPPPTSQGDPSIWEGHPGVRERDPGVQEGDPGIWVRPHCDDSEGCGAPKGSWGLPKAFRGTQACWWPPLPQPRGTLASTRGPRHPAGPPTTMHPWVVTLQMGVGVSLRLFGGPRHGGGPPPPHAEPRHALVPPPPSQEDPGLRVRPPPRHDAPEGCGAPRWTWALHKRFGGDPGLVVVVATPCPTRES